MEHVYHFNKSEITLTADPQHARYNAMHFSQARPHFVHIFIM